MDQPARTYENDRISVEWHPERCIHARFCVRGLSDVFDPRRRPWVAPGEHTADEIAAVIQRCPSGALHYRRKDGGPEESIPTGLTVEPVPNGPLYVRGDIEVRDADGNLIRRDTRMALCRCGESTNKPFCDNSHLRINFQAP